MVKGFLHVEGGIRITRNAQDESTQLLKVLLLEVLQWYCSIIIYDI